MHCNNSLCLIEKAYLSRRLKLIVGYIDVANVQNVFHNFWKERVLLRSLQY